MHHIGVDIGGTFTDCVLVDEDGGHYSAKSLSTKPDPVGGVRTGLTQLAEQIGAGGLSGLLAQTAELAHGTTIGTNAVLERRGARVGMITTRGHGDALSIMRGRGRVAGRAIEEVFQVHGTALPEPIVVAGAVLEIDERIDRDGAVVVPLDQSALRDRLKGFIAEYELDAVAVALLWSFRNDSHERAVEAALREVAPDIFISLSVDVSPRSGEFERMVATVINGYVGPLCSRYLSELDNSLREGGLASPLLVMQSNGGELPVSVAGKTALGTIDSGPSGGLIGVAGLAARYGHPRVVATDMGGTSFDIGLVVDGEPVMAEENVVDQYTYRLPHLDVRTVACGGGTLARRDEHTGAIRVGPESAGSVPGPACYGGGGLEPTVTDADVVLGLIRADGFLDGRMPLDAEAARAAVGRLAEDLGLSVEDTAAGIIDVNNMRAATLIRQQTIERGQDPRDFVLYAYGGAGPVHAFGFAAECGVQEVIIPLGNGASTLSAFGIASGEVIRYLETETSLFAPFDTVQLRSEIDAAVAAAGRALEETGVSEPPQITVVAEMRFAAQMLNRIEVPVTLPVAEDTAEQLLADFHTEYIRRFGEGGTKLFGAAEIFAWRVRANAVSHFPEVAAHSGEAVAVADDRTTRVFWPSVREWTTTRLATDADIASGSAIDGPALVELAHTTISVPPGAELSLGDRGELRLRLDMTNSEATR